MNPDDAEIEDILAPGPKKRIKCGNKGKRAERGICKDLIDRFRPLLCQHPAWGLFSRSVGSGNRWGQKVVLSQTAAETFSGDIVPPTNFKFSIESKNGYNDIDLAASFAKGHREIDEFLKQAGDDGDRSGRKPMLIWKKDRKPRLVALRAGEVPVEVEKTWQYRMHYREWMIYSFEDVFGLPDDFFFNLPKDANVASVEQPVRVGDSPERTEPPQPG